MVILKYPNAQLRQVSESVETITDEHQTLAVNMFRTMYANAGIGLAAPQVGRLIRLIVWDVSKDQSNPMALFNPRIAFSEGSQRSTEGCLSMPYVYAPVKRAAYVKVIGQNGHGEKLTIEATGLLAVCLQHEIDHLDGIEFIDHISVPEQMLAFKKAMQLRQTVARRYA